jgi:hypothetical protein
MKNNEITIPHNILLVLQAITTTAVAEIYSKVQSYTPLLASKFLSFMWRRNMKKETV